MIDKHQFHDWFVALTDRFGKNYSDITVGLYFRKLSSALTTEQFVKAADHLFTEGTELPNPAEFIKLARSLSPDVYVLPAHTPKAYVDMTPEEQEVFRANIRRVRSIAENASNPDQMRSVAQVASKIAREANLS